MTKLEISVTSILKRKYLDKWKLPGIATKTRCLMKSSCIDICRPGPPCPGEPSGFTVQLGLLRAHSQLKLLGTAGARDQRSRPAKTKRLSSKCFGSLIFGTCDLSNERPGETMNIMRLTQGNMERQRGQFFFSGRHPVTRHQCHGPSKTTVGITKGLNNYV